MGQHQGQGVLLDPGGPVEAHLVDPLQQLRFPAHHHTRFKPKQCGDQARVAGGGLTV